MKAQPITHFQRSSWQEYAIRFVFRIFGNILPNFISKLALYLFVTPRRKQLTEQEEYILSKAQKVDITNGKINLVGYIWGEGPTVVLVHGWESRAGRLSTFVAPLQSQGFRVVAFDGPAHGLSSGNQTDLIDFGQAIQTVIDKFGPIYGIISHSFGASSTMFLLAHEPNITVKKVVIIGAPSDLKDVIATFANMLSIPDKVIRRFKERLVSKVGKPIDIFSVRNFAHLIKIPGLVVHDRNDAVVPFKDAEAIATAWPTATLISTKGLGHRGPLQNDKVIKEVINFLFDKETL